MSTAQKLLVALLVCFLAITPSWAQSFPTGFARVLVSGAITQPTTMAFAPDGRIFVAQQTGQIRIIKNNTLVTDPFIELTVDATGERGLIGMTFDPSFVDNQFIYLYYTVPGTTAHNRVSRFTASGDVVVPASEVILLDLDPLGAAKIHNGGALAFGNDGKLYVAVGENSHGPNAQDLDTNLGKILRINPDGGVPDGNPFPSGSEQKKRVWAYGVRNPYTISVNRLNGKIFVNDVGANAWEEINDITEGGANFGWPTAEGNSANVAFTNPLYTYPHGTGDGIGCAITGGTFFNPNETNYPSEFYNKYFLLDFCGRWINTINPGDAAPTPSSFASAIGNNPLVMDVGPDGNIYYLSRAASVFKIVYNNTSPPFVVTPPVDAQVLEGLPVTFSVKAIGTLPLTYQWQKNGVDIGGTTGTSFTITIADPIDDGQFAVIVSNVAGNVTSLPASLLVTPVNDAPLVHIFWPAYNSEYSAGSSISFSGVGIDQEDGDLDQQRFSWRFVSYFDDLVSDETIIEDVKSGNFEIPNTGLTSANTLYEIYLTVTDSEGLESVESVIIVPRKSELTFDTSPPGLKIMLDGLEVDTPLSVESVEGLVRNISVGSGQLLGDQTYNFSTWSQGGEATQTIVTPVDNATYTASFSVVLGAESLNTRMVSVYPNPSNGPTAFVDIHSTSSQTATIEILGLLSDPIVRIPVQLLKGNNTIALPLKDLGKGIAFVSITMGTERVVRKLVVR